ncbi:hypothetical protein GCM10023317_31220 [Actinopolymorpha pittospori]|uniref:Uncharacterized protein n=1 Tax=Actinopolymorpha pittospori TaxID=648752 RepID=A0A927N8B9_9ACTN|nr:hypothetical protein [Actinopolymorpha pittospori]
MSSSAPFHCDVCHSADARFVVHYANVSMQICEACGRFIYSGFVTSRQDLRPPWVRLDHWNTDRGDLWAAPARLVRLVRALDLFARRFGRAGGADGDVVPDL